MSYLAGSLRDASNVQVALFDAFENLPNVNSVQQVPHLSWTYSDANRGSLEMRVSTGGGQVKTVEVGYFAEIAESAVSSDVANPVCTTGDTEVDRWETYEIDTTENRSAARTFSRTDLVKAIRSNPDYVFQVINMLMFAVEKAVAAKTATEAVALAGAWHDDVESIYTVTSDELTLPTLDAADAFRMAPFTLEDIQTALEITGYTAQPVIFGGATLPKYIKRMLAGATGDTGIDLMKMLEVYGIGASRDKYIKDALSSENKNLAFLPGATQLLTYTASEWTDGIPMVDAGSNYEMARMIAPRTGIPMDVHVFDNCGQITFRVTATTKLVGLPSDMFSEGNGHADVTFVNKITIDNS